MDCLKVPRSLDRDTKFVRPFVQRLSHDHVGLTLEDLDEVIGDFAKRSSSGISVPGGESRAALEEGLAEGLWTFKIDKVWGSVSRVEIQIYEGALPTSGTKDDDLFAVCASSPDPYNRPQEACSRTVSGPIATAGSLSIKRVKQGATGAITLDAGVYCVRPLAFGKGGVTVSIEHQ